MTLLLEIPDTNTPSGSRGSGSRNEMWTGRYGQLSSNKQKSEQKRVRGDRSRRTLAASNVRSICKARWRIVAGSQAGPALHSTDPKLRLIAPRATAIPTPPTCDVHSTASGPFFHTVGGWCMGEDLTLHGQRGRRITIVQIDQWPRLDIDVDLSRP